MRPFPSELIAYWQGHFSGVTETVGWRGYSVFVQSSRAAYVVTTLRRSEPDIRSRRQYYAVRLSVATGTQVSLQLEDTA
jgi:hypothetical protein